MTARNVRKLSTLLEISQTLSSPVELRTALMQVLELLEEQHDSVSGSITLLEEATGELVIEAATGINWKVQRRATYKVGEGVTGRVVESGRPIIVPRVSHEPLFLDRTEVWKAGAHPELSFVCVPIQVDGKAKGSLGVTLPFDEDREFPPETQFLSVVASMIGQSVRVSDLVETERQNLVSENTQLRQELREKYEFRNIIGNSSQMRDVYQQIAQVAGSPTTVMIRGESGTGKEMVAHAIHYNSARADGPFIKVNCGALPDTLIESELFGYEPGAFTDAREQKKGRFELADGGTLFLDEIGELSPSTQVKVLRALQEKEFERLGGVQSIRVDVRLITATNRDLESAMKQGSFREDLYYRLNVFSIFMPALRDRKPDILLLADHFAEKYATVLGKSVRRISTPAIDMLMAYHWPGNVRELENCVERAVLVCQGSVIHGHDLPPTLQTAQVSGTLPDVSLEVAVGNYERDLLLDSLKSARGNQAEVARLLQTTSRIVGYKLKKHGIDPTRYRSASRPSWDA
ncbi:MAG: sigma 54-interacting transcriptional regulator [Gemmatimonadota bacterium]|nr:sigma 54-interacting transcriptional regulator [Gemmatimonadota bacterium]